MFSKMDRLKDVIQYLEEHRKYIVKVVYYVKTGDSKIVLVITHEDKIVELDVFIILGYFKYKIQKFNVSKGEMETIEWGVVDFKKSREEEQKYMGFLSNVVNIWQSI